MEVVNKKLKPIPQPQELDDRELVIPMRAKIAWWSMTLLVVGGIACLAALMVLSRQESDVLRSGTAAVVNEVSELRGEVASLRNDMSSSVSEEIIFLKVLVMNPKVKIPFAWEAARSIHTHCRQLQRDPDLVLAIIEIESNFNVKAVSSAGAIGLMQVMPEWRELGLDGDLKDIDTNIHHGIVVYGFYEKMYNNDMRIALSAYNRGPDKVQRDIRANRDPTSNGYADKIIKVYERLKSMRRGKV